MHGIPNKLLRRLLATAALALTLSACGGGGGGGDNPPPPAADVSPEPWSFSPAQIDDARPGETYEATATVTGFDGELAARVLGKNGKAEFSLVSGEEEVDELAIKSGDTIRVRAVLSEEAAFGEQTQVTVAVGQDDAAQSASFNLNIADTAAPDISVSFPTALSTTHGETITLTGHWSDNGNGPVTLQFAHNGQQTDTPPHVVFPDGTWQITVPLEPGSNALSVSATDAAGFVSDPRMVTVVRDTPLFDAPESVAFDAPNNRMYVLNVSTVTSIVEIDLATNQRRVVARADVDNDGNPQEVFAGKLLLDGDRLLLLDTFDPDNNKLIAINISDGARSDIVDGFVQARSIEHGPSVDGENTVFMIGKTVASAAANPPLAPEILRVKLDSRSTMIFSRPDSNNNDIGGGNTVWEVPIDAVYDTRNGFLYVIDFLSSNLYRIDGVGNRTLIVSDSGIRPDLPFAVTVDNDNGRVYIANRAPSAPILSIDFDSSTFEEFRTNDENLPLTRPSDILLVQRDHGKVFWVVDSFRREGIVEIALDTPEGEIVPSFDTDTGLAFDDPQTLTLDADNHRLLVLSPGGIQGVNIDNGHRNDHDLFDMDSETLMGGMQIFGEDLWVTLSGNSRGLGTISRAALGSGDAAPPSAFNEVLDDPGNFETSTGLLVDENSVMVGSRHTFDISGAAKDSLYRIDRNNGNAVSELLTAAHAGGFRKHLMRVDDTRIIHGDEADIELVDLADPENPVIESLLLPDVPENVSGVDAYAYDAINKRLYMVGGIDQDVETQFGFVDISDLGGDLTALPVTQITATVADGNQEMPGYGTAITHLRGFALDAERNRLFALGKLGDTDEGDEIVLINLAPVAVDEDGNPGFDKDEEGNLILKQTGETVMISRSNGPRGTS